MRKALLFCGCLAACAAAPDEDFNTAEPTVFAFTEPEASGLVSVRPYPTDSDVCRVIGENDATRELLDDAALLIGCPKHEFGAIEDRVAEGAQLVAHARHWSLFSVPLR